MTAILTVFITFEVPLRERSATLPIIIPSYLKEDLRADLKRSRTLEASNVKETADCINTNVNNNLNDEETDSNNEDNKEDNRSELTNYKNIDLTRDTDKSMCEELEVIDTGTVGAELDAPLKNDKIYIQGGDHNINAHDNNNNNSSNAPQHSVDLFTSEENVDALREMLTSSNNSRDSLKSSLETKENPLVG